MIIVALIYALLCVADVWLTLKCLTIVGVKEANPLMLLLLKSPPAFYVAQVVINMIVIAMILEWGIGFGILTLIIKGAIVANNAMIYSKNR